MGQVVWTPRALDDLLEIHRFIARDSLHAAEALVDRLVSATERLADHPQSGRLVPELTDEDYREVILPPYRIFYRIEGETAWITGVIHGSRLVTSDRVEEAVAAYR